MYATAANGADARFIETAKVGFWFNTQNLAKPTHRAGDRAEAVYLDIKNPHRMGSLDALADEVEQARGGERFAEWLEDQGYDGLEVMDEEFGGTSYVALRPEQIKSATDNIGTFDRENPDIRFSREGDQAFVQELRNLDRTHLAILTACALACLRGRRAGHKETAGGSDKPPAAFSLIWCSKCCALQGLT